MSILTTFWTKSGSFSSLLAASTSLIFVGVIVFQESFQEQQVVIASNPSNVKLSIDGKELGVTPLTVGLKKGVYTIEAEKEGYEALEHAIYVSQKETNVVNIQLLSANNTNGLLSSTNDITEISDIKNFEELEIELNKLQSLIIANPEEAATIPILNVRMESLSVEVQALREEISELRGQNKWYLGSMIAMIVGLLGVIATLFIANKGK